MPPGRFPTVLLIGGFALIVVGAAVLTLVPTTQFGWFAYAPLSESTFGPGVVLGAAQLSGAATAVVGLVATSGAAGYLAGRRAGRRA